MLFVLQACLVMICLCPPNLCHADQNKLHISFVSPSRNDSHFWGTAHDFARASAMDLNIDFKVYYSRDNNRFTYLDAFKQAVLAKEKPDAVMGVFFRFIGSDLLEMARKKDIPVFMLNSNIPDDEVEDIGAVREKYKNFIGHMAPDEKAAGCLLARYLIQKAKKMNPGKEIKIGGLSGHRESPVSLNRSAGLIKAAKDENAKLSQIIFIDWTQPEEPMRRDIETGTKALLQRYPDMEALWCISDGMALTGRAIARNLNREVLVGGIDWKKEAIVQVKKKVLDASMGGHFTEIGFGLVLLYDYFHGKDFYEELGGRIKTRMALLTRENVDRYYGFLIDQNWDAVDFRKYSKILNPKLKTYDFSFESLMNKMDENQ